MLQIAAALVLCLAGLPAAFAQSYPTRPVTVLVPYLAGGGTDLLARLLAQKLEKRLGKPFVVENKPGSGTVIAASALARAAPDGHTIMLATSTTMAINVSVYKNLPYDPAKDFAPLALVTASPFILVVNPSLPVRSVADLVAYAKARPNALNYGSSGIGSFHHLNGELLQSVTGIKMTHIPYKATPPALNDIVAGHVHLMFGDVTSTIPLIQEGKLRALGVSTAQRVASASDIPPLAEVGIPGFDSSSWQMVIAPAGTPRPIVDLLNKTFRDIVSESDVQHELGRRGMIPIASDPPDRLQKFVRDEIQRWSKIVHQAGAVGAAQGQ